MLVCGGWLVCGGVLYIWIAVPFYFLVTRVSEACLTGWFLERQMVEPNDSGSAYAQLDLGGMELPSTYERDDHIFYTMLEKHECRTLTITRDLGDEVYESAGGSAKMVLGEHKTKFMADTEIDADRPLTCQMTYPRQEKRVKVVWSEPSPDASNDGEGEKRSVQKRGYIPVEAVKPVYTREKARREYHEMMRVYKKTGSTKSAWIAYFFQPLFLPLFTSMFCTLAVRLVLHYACWPVVSGQGNGFKGAYVHGLRTFQERKIVTYVGLMLGQADSLREKLPALVQSLNLIL
eukprot:TRINITY_DN11933_c0_g1_i3.p1 TRINITY_DN11933_c0_g1~~TRINITY_DN11933_c0_g1_i3.p1  ORF type:complete len:290 (+),score=20.65 TRINITY_DN11933_c0_g1_i3:137-1006(+)